MACYHQTCRETKLAGWCIISGSLLTSVHRFGVAGAYFEMMGMKLTRNNENNQTLTRAISGTSVYGKDDTAQTKTSCPGNTLDKTVLKVFAFDNV